MALAKECEGSGGTYMDSIGSMSSTDYTSYVNNAYIDSLTNGINKVNQDTSTDEEMLEACKEFETYMVEQVYKQMEKTIMKADEEENEYEQYFGDYRIQEYAKMVTEQGRLGLAQQLYEAMTANKGISVEDMNKSADGIEESGVDVGVSL